jgi:hypothetical protein
MNAHYPEVMLELRALPLLEKYASAEDDAEMALHAQLKTAELCNRLVKFVYQQSSHFEVESGLTEKEAAVARGVAFAMSLRETHGATGEKFAAAPEVAAELVKKFATALYLDQVLDEQRRAGVKEAAECQALGREYAIEVLRSLLA